VISQTRGSMCDMHSIVTTHRPPVQHQSPEPPQAEPVGGNSQPATGHRLAQAESLTLADLAGESWVLTAR